MRELVIYGLGELGQLYGAAALRSGLRVMPITRAMSAQDTLQAVPLDVPVLIAVGEDSLAEALSALELQRERPTILLQNELFPSQWERHGGVPTVLVPWLLKKRGLPLSVARVTPVWGRHAELICELHRALDAPVIALASEHALHQALVEKYAFILTINALGLVRDRTLGHWLQEDPRRVEALALETARLGALLCAAEVDLAACSRATNEAMAALRAIGARGRSAQARVQRALAHGARLGMPLPELTEAARAQHG